MNNYFNPDISMLREIPKVESEKLLATATSTVIRPETPEVSEASKHQVEQLLYMIQLARSSGSTLQPLRA